MSKLSHSNQETMDQIERQSRKDDIEHCQCPACIDGVIHDSDCAVHNMPAFSNGPCNCRIAKQHGSINKMIARFLGWQLPYGFSPDCGVHFDGAGKTLSEYVDSAGYRRSWPVGTNLFTAEQTREMFEHCLQDQKLATLESQPVPVEPVDIEYIHKFINSAPFGEHCPPEDMARAHGIIDSLTAALQRAQEDAARERRISSKAEHDLDAALVAKQKAESLNRRMVELLKEPSEGMVSVVIKNMFCDSTENEKCARAAISAMSEQLLKEAGE